MTQQPPGQPEASALVPPRPNLGPDPWPEDRGWPAWPGWTGALAAILILVLLRRRSHSRTIGTDPSENEPPHGPEETDPGQRLIAMSESLRNAMIQAFGTNWRSKTTEEIGREPGLTARLEPADVERLIGFLKLADRLKFASGESEPMEGWEEWATSVVKRLGQPAASPETRQKS